MRLFPWLVMLCAAFTAGAINSIAGGGTLLTFPVLIWLGLDPKVANGTSTVALWPGLFGGLYGYRKELENSSTILFRLGVTSVIGGALGAWLLIWTPSPLFASLVPFLILFATILFMFHGEINKRLRLGSLEHKQMGLYWTGAIIFQFFSAMYGGYFGAGLGVILLAVLGLVLTDSLTRINGLRGALALLVNSIAAVTFMIAADVAWAAAAVLALTSLVGGYSGARLSRRLPAPVLRVVVIAIGLVAAIRLLAD